PPAGVGRGVAVVGGGGHVGQFRERVGQGDHGGQLVLPQRLGRGQVERAGVAVGGERTQGGQLVAERFPGGGAGGHHHVPAGVRVLGGGGLVLPGALEAALTQDVHQARVCPPGPLGEPRRTGGQVRGVRQGRAVLREGAEQVLQELASVRRHASTVVRSAGAFGPRLRRPREIGSLGARLVVYWIRSTRPVVRIPEGGRVRPDTRGHPA